MNVPGLRVNRFRLVAKLGEGASGEVYRAVDERLARDVALKLLRVSTSDDEAYARALREARAASTLTHPGIVAIHDVGIADDERGGKVAFIAMELVSGQPLRAYVGDSGVPLQRRVAWLCDVAEALAYAHSHGLVHRDVKPANVMISDGGAVKVLDFGIARREGAEATFDSSAHALAGTPAYMAPEQIRNEPVDARADQFAWGVMAYELLAGKRPWREGGSLLDLAADVVARTPTPLHALCPEVPEGVERVVLRALAKAREARFATMRELLDAIGACDAATGATPAPPPRRSTRATPALRVPARALGLAATLALATSGGAWALHTRDRAHRAPPAAPECRHTRECVQGHRGEHWRCVIDEGACAPLESIDCRALGEPADFDRDDTVWLGAMLPTSGPDGTAFGRAEADAIDLARRDFAQALPGLRASGQAPPPIGALVCDDEANPERAARHLAEVARVPAVIGFRGGAELVDVATRFFLPRRMVTVAALNGGPEVTRIPEPGPTRLVWRTTYDLVSTARPIRELVDGVLRPRSNALDRPTRIALLRPRNRAGEAYADALFDAFAKGRGRFPERDSFFRQVLFDDPAAGVAPDYDAVTEALARFRPEVIVYMGGAPLVDHVFAPLEAAWPRAAPRPTYVAVSVLPDRAFTFIGTNASLRHRFFGITTESATPANVKLVMHYNATFASPTTPTTSPNGSYDAFYLLAYAVYAHGAAPVTGRDLAEEFPRFRQGPHVAVGPTQIFDAFGALRGGGTIDLEGSAGPLDLDPKTGESEVPMVVLCVDVDEAGRAVDTRESGLVSAPSGGLTGTLRCP